MHDRLVYLRPHGVNVCSGQSIAHLEPDECYLGGSNLSSFVQSHQAMQIAAPNMNRACTTGLSCPCKRGQAPSCSRELTHYGSALELQTFNCN
eukprot:scaffold34471_cov15-Tisochrysis_lutea.AAC.1